MGTCGCSPGRSKHTDRTAAMKNPAHESPKTSSRQVVSPTAATEESGRRKMRQGRPRKGEERARLTEAEREVLARALLQTGIPRARIARENGIDRRTYERYLRGLSAPPDRELLVSPLLSARSAGARGSEEDALITPDMLREPPARMIGLYVVIHRITFRIAIDGREEKKRFAALMRSRPHRSVRRSDAPYRHQWLVNCLSARGTFFVRFAPGGKARKKANRSFAIVEVHGSALESGAVYEVVELLAGFCDPIACISEIDLAQDRVFEKPTTPLIMCADARARKCEVLLPKHSAVRSRAVNIRYGSRKSGRTVLCYAKLVQLEDLRLCGRAVTTPSHLRADIEAGYDVHRTDSPKCSTCAPSLRWHWLHTRIIAGLAPRPLERLEWQHQDRRIRPR